METIATASRFAAAIEPARRRESSHQSVCMVHGCFCRGRAIQIIHCVMVPPSFLSR